MRGGECCNVKSVSVSRVRGKKDFSFIGSGKQGQKDWVWGSNGIYGIRVYLILRSAILSLLLLSCEWAKVQGPGGRIEA